MISLGLPCRTEYLSIYVLVLSCRAVPWRTNYQSCTHLVNILNLSYGLIRFLCLQYSQSHCHTHKTVSVQVISGLYPGVTTVELDNLAAEIAATMTTTHPDYAVLAARSFAY